MLNNILTDQQCEQLHTLIEEAETIVITCHTNADGDAIGSSLGWAEYLKSLGKEPTIVVPDQYPDYLHWMPNTEKIVRYDKHQEQCDLLLKIADLVFCLDFNTVSRVDQMQKSLSLSPAKKVLVDHHLNPDVDTVLTISHPDMSSTSELVFRLVWQLGGFDQLGKHFAVPVYCGMMTDTGGFTFNSNDPNIFYIISQLLTKGINKDRIYRNVYHNFSENRLRLTGFVMLERLVVDTERHASFYALRRTDLKRFQFVKGDAEGLVNMPLQIKGLKLSISLREDTERDNLVWVSLRSVDDFPCNKMAEDFFNGGGHLNASGGRLNCTIDEAVSIAQQAILHYEQLLK
ncbi:MAG: DHH family phosphoesterase [Prevotella sp.]|jgi:phosphoesterase RecJ-like protein|nr:DHH family phosphoesterase [Prevotella sp.]